MASAALRLSQLIPRHRSVALQQARRKSVARSGCDNELPPELRDLRITEDGLLVDEKSGEVINEYGATRFDVAVRALRGDFDPPKGTENTERSSGVLMDSLVQWPTVYDFQFVIRAEGGSPTELAAQLRQKVAAVCQVDIAVERCTARERKGGKYVSVCVPTLVRAPEYIQRVLDAVGEDPRVLMKY